MRDKTKKHHSTTANLVSRKDPEDLKSRIAKELSDDMDGMATLGANLTAKQLRIYITSGKVPLLPKGQEGSVTGSLMSTASVEDADDEISEFTLEGTLSVSSGRLASIASIAVVSDILYKQLTILTGHVSRSYPDNVRLREDLLYVRRAVDAYLTDNLLRATLAGTSAMFTAFDVHYKESGSAKPSKVADYFPEATGTLLGGLVVFDRVMAGTSVSKADMDVDYEEEFDQIVEEMECSRIAGIMMTDDSLPDADAMQRACDISGFISRIELLDRNAPDAVEKPQPDMHGNIATFNNKTKH